MIASDKNHSDQFLPARLRSNFPNQRESDPYKDDSDRPARDLVPVSVVRYGWVYFRFRYWFPFIRLGELRHVGATRSGDRPLSFN